MTRLGVEYAVGWPLLSLLLSAGYVRLATVIRRDDARRRAHNRRPAPTNVRVLKP